MKKEINIRLNANRAKVVNTGYKFSSGDKGIVLKIAVDELDTAGTTAKIVFKRSNGTSVESNITAAENVYSYTTLGNEFEVVGPVVADVKFYEGENRVSTSTFIFEVTSDTMDGIGAGTAGYSDTLEQMKESMLQAQDGMNATKGEMETLSSQLETLYDSYAEAFGTTGAFNPRGNYSAEESYTVRDLVSYNGGMWICNKNCTGAIPGPESDCWQYFFSHAEIEAIITGTQQVGNAKTLDGHGAEYFLPKKNGVIPKGTSLFFEKDDNSTLSGNVRFEVNGDYLRIFENGGKSRGVVVKLSDCADWIGSVLLHSGNISNYAFMPTGGDIGNGKNPYPIFLKGYNSYSLIEYGDENRNKFGLIGFNGIDNPVILTADKTKSYTILHTGNKPTGSYTGNGDGGSRTISVGGIGGILAISTDTTLAIVGNGGFVAVDGSTGTITGGGNAFYSTNGNLYFSTTHGAINASGKSYTYHNL